jgi:hypothetical protein
MSIFIYGFDLCQNSSRKEYRSTRIQTAEINTSWLPEENLKRKAAYRAHRKRHLRLSPMHVVQMMALGNSTADSNLDYTDDIRLV